MGGTSVQRDRVESEVNHGTTGLGKNPCFLPTRGSRSGLREKLGFPVATLSSQKRVTRE